MTKRTAKDYEAQIATLTDALKNLRDHIVWPGHPQTTQQLIEAADVALGIKPEPWHMHWREVA